VWTQGDFGTLMPFKSREESIPSGSHPGSPSCGVSIPGLLRRSRLWQYQVMPVTDSVLLAFLAVAAVIHIAGITILGFLLRESLRITRAVGALVIQEEEKTRRLFQR
jgi:hypothetical protein